MADVDDLERGREAYAARVWRDAHERLSAADVAAPLGMNELEVLLRPLTCSAMTKST